MMVLIMLGFLTYQEMKMDDALGITRSTPYVRQCDGTRYHTPEALIACSERVNKAMRAESCIKGWEPCPGITVTTKLIRE